MERMMTKKETSTSKEFPARQSLEKAIRDAIAFWEDIIACISPSKIKRYRVCVLR